MMMLCSLDSMLLMIMMSSFLSRRLNIFYAKINKYTMKSFPTILLIIACTNAFTSTSTQRRRILPQQQQQQPICNNNGPIVTRLQSSSASSSSSKPEQSKAQALPPPSTFREAEVAGLRLMQDGRHEEALKENQACSSLLYCTIYGFMTIACNVHDMMYDISYARHLSDG
eukprot:scaffold1955_cov122-Skeletonema_marinoi.AAC.7